MENKPKLHPPSERSKDMIAQATKTQKQVQVLATYTFKNRNRVCFTVLSSNGSDRYNTCFDNGRGACSCPARGGCYHLTQLAPRAARIIEEQETKAANVRYMYSQEPAS